VTSVIKNMGQLGNRKHAWLLPHGRTFDFTFTIWLLPKEDTAGRPLP
jgi:hypothetical protein